MGNFSNTLIQIVSNGMGQGNEILAHKLIANYLNLLLSENELPAIITLYNAGVKLVAEGSPVLEPLCELESRGVKLLSCRTCIDFYGLTEKVKVGLVGTMIDIITLQGKAEKVINL